MQTYIDPVDGVTTFADVYNVLAGTLGTLRSRFSGTAFPASPVAGQPCYRTDRLTVNGYPKCYTYTNNPALGESGWVEDVLGTTLGEEIVNARGTKPSVAQRLDVALNEDGTLKASTTLNPSQWFLPSLTFTYISTTSFRVNGDQTDIYKAARRLKINLSASTVYSEVVSASYSSPNTTVQVLDAVLSATLVSVEHSLHLPDWDGKSAISPRMAGNYKIKSVSADYTTTLNDDVILVDASGAARTITVLAAATLGAGRRQKVIKTDSSTNAVTIDPNGSETINGNATYAITVPLTGIEFESDGTNLRTIDDSTDKVTGSDIFSDFVVSGLLGTDPGAVLGMTIPPGVAYIIGRRVVKLAGAADLTRTYTASKDTYVDISHTGAITYTEVTNGAGAPSVAANSLRLMCVVTNGSEITGVTDLRILVGVQKAELNMTGEASATGFTVTTALSLGNVKAGDRIFVCATASILSSTAPTYPQAAVMKSGTAVVVWFNGVGNPLYPLVSTAALAQDGSFSGVLKVTTSGSLTLTNTISYVGGSGLNLSNQIYAFFLKRN